MAETKYITGKTDQGFEFKIDVDLFDDWELVEILGEVDENKIWRLSRGFEILLGKDGFEKLKDNLLEKQGRIKTSALFKEFNDIFTSNQKTKNS